MRWWCVENYSDRGREKKTRKQSVESVNDVEIKGPVRMWYRKLSLKLNDGGMEGMDRGWWWTYEVYYYKCGDVGQDLARVAVKERRTFLATVSRWQPARITRSRVDDHLSFR